VSECVYGVLPTDTPLMESFAPGGSDVMSVVLEHPIMTNETSSTLAMIRTKRVDMSTPITTWKYFTIRIEYSTIGRLRHECRTCDPIGVPKAIHTPSAIHHIYCGSGGAIAAHRTTVFASILPNMKRLAWPICIRQRNDVNASSKPGEINGIGRQSRSKLNSCWGIDSDDIV